MPQLYNYLRCCALTTRLEQRFITCIYRECPRQPAAEKHCYGNNSHIRIPRMPTTASSRNTAIATIQTCVYQECPRQRAAKILRATIQNCVYRERHDSQQYKHCEQRFRIAYTESATTASSINTASNDSELRIPRVPRQPAVWTLRATIQNCVHRECSRQPDSWLSETARQLSLHYIKFNSFFKSLFSNKCS